MRLDGRRESSNVDDRRGMSGGAKAGLGLGGIVLIAVMTFLSGGNLGDVITNVGTQMASQNVTTSDQQQREFTEEEQAMAKFSSQVLASTEDIWGKVFESMGRQYQAPKMVLYTAIALVGYGNSNIFSMAFSEALLSVPDKQNEVSGLMIMGLFGGTIFPLIMGFCSDAVGQAGAVAVMAVGVIYLFTYIPRIKR